MQGRCLNVGFIIFNSYFSDTRIWRNIHMSDTVTITRQSVNCPIRVFIHSFRRVHITWDIEGLYDLL